MRGLELTPRLRRIADSIRGYETMADIGSDHAYLPIYLVKSGLIKKAVATDVNMGPVEISRKRLANHRAADRVEVRHGDGLAVLMPGEAEVIVIAGMGGILIKEILEKEREKAGSARLLILQPMRDSELLRAWLLSNGFEIIDEELVKEAEKIYEIIWAKPGSEKHDAASKLFIGTRIIEKKHPLALELIDRRIKELEKILDSLDISNSDSAQDRRAVCLEMLAYYREVRQWVL